MKEKWFDKSSPFKTYETCLFLLGKKPCARDRTTPWGLYLSSQLRPNSHTSCSMNNTRKATLRPRYVTTLCQQSFRPQLYTFINHWRLAKQMAVMCFSIYESAPSSLISHSYTVKSIGFSRWGHHCVKTPGHRLYFCGINTGGPEVVGSISHGLKRTLCVYVRMHVRALVLQQQRIAARQSIAGHMWDHPRTCSKRIQTSWQTATKKWMSPHQSKTLRV